MRTTVKLAMNGKLNPGDMERLIRAVGDGDTDALAALYEALRGPVYAVALSYLKNGEDARDVTQDTFLRIWENAERYNPRGTPAAWVMTIARNLALSRLREDSRRGELSEDEWQAIPARAPEVTAEDREVLQTALSTLGDEERRVVLLHAAAGMKHREIAEILDMPLATVLSKYRRALKKLKSSMESEGVL